MRLWYTLASVLFFGQGERTCKMSRRLNLQTFSLFKLRWRHGSSLRQAFELSLRFSIGEERGWGTAAVQPQQLVQVEEDRAGVGRGFQCTTGIKWLWFPLLHKLWRWPKILLLSKVCLFSLRNSSIMSGPLGVHLLRHLFKRKNSFVKWGGFSSLRGAATGGQREGWCHH